MMKRWLMSLVCVWTLLGCTPQVDQVQFGGPTMGTTYHVKYILDENTPSVDLVQKQVDTLLEQVNAQMSTYQHDSELSQFNQYVGSEPFPVSHDTATVVREAIRLHAVTQGKLDVTVGPLVNLWGFGPEGRPNVTPTEQALEEKRSQIGIERLSVVNDTLIKTQPSVYVDLSTIAKGWGVDKIANYLDNNHINNYMVEVGGEIRLKGHNRNGVPWRIAIEKPIDNERTVQEIISPKDMAMATSGDYRNYFEQDGVRYSHIIDPQTGRPIHHRVVSVTVLHPSCMTADGLATGLMVLGEHQGLEVAEQQNLPVLMIVKTEDGFKTVTSTAFQSYLN
ncbi:Thiamine biosynthesis lipoprotein ApbE precursor [Vibrio palustris]|uniref:FAD:protein FMN transferase n=2 Tax=Vibrio palustris TaxID=1918946 RepID=A0A1R4AZX5_9VIBR|nr:Thiamine biosynthesis lipoprotein ApbE precursor [Vibrio palustris]